MSSADILNQPFHPPPPGVMPNQLNQQSRGRDLTTTCSVFLGMMISFVFVRAYTKLCIMRKVTWDDLTCLSGFLLTVIYYATCVRDVLSGYVGYHSWDVTLGQVAASDFYVLSYVQELVNPLALGFIKLSFFILYLQIFQPLPKMRTVIWINATICIMFYALIFTLNIYFSTPRQGETYFTHSFNPIVKTGIRLSVPFAAFGLVFDLVIITIPIYGVCQLQLSGRQKLSISLLFLTGGFACVSAMLTLNYRIALQITDDVLRVLVPNLTTSLVEMMIGVICTCAPSFSKTLHEHLPSYKTLKSRLQSSFRSTAQFIAKGSTKSSSGYERQDSNQNSCDHISYKERMTGGTIPGDGAYQMRNRNFFQTLVKEGPEGFATEDDIHLKNEIFQERTAGDELYPGDKRKWEPNTAVTEADMV